MADQILQRAATLARQLRDHNLADQFDSTIRDHAQGICPGVDQGVGCYRERKARDYLAAIAELAEAKKDVERLESNEEFVERALHLVLGCCDPATGEECPGRAEKVYQAMRNGVKVPYCWQYLSEAMVVRTNEREQLRAELQRERESRQGLIDALRARAQLAEGERDKADRDNESLARRLHLRFESEEKLRAELDELKTKRLWRTAPISGVMHLVPDGDVRRESVCGLTASTTWRPAIDGNASCLECSRWQPVTEATSEQDGPTLEDLSGPECGKTGKPGSVGCDGTCSACTPDDVPATPTEPRVWHEGDAEPFNVSQVRDNQGDVWTRIATGLGQQWTSPDTKPFHWARITKKWAPLTEVFQDGTQ